MSIRDWIRDKIEGLGKWIADKIIAPIVKWFRDRIEEIRVAIRVFRHVINDLIAKWLSTDIGFLSFIATIVLGVIYIPAWLNRLKGIKLWIFLESMTIKITEKVLTLIDVKRVIDLKLLHTVLKVFWPAYREAMKAFSDSISQLAAELGEGSAYIHAYLASGRMLYMGSAAILGAPMETAEAEWYASSTEFMERVNDKFIRYARDPGLLYYDYVDWYLREAYGTYRALNQAELDQIRDNYKRTLEIEKGVALVAEGMESLAKQLPNEVEDQFRRRWAPAKEFIDDVIAEWQTVFKPMILEIVTAVEERAGYQEQINEKVLAEISDPNTLLENWMLYGDEAKDIAAGGFEYILSQAIIDDIEVGGKLVSEWTGRLHAIELQSMKDIMAIPALSYEAVGIRFKPDIRLALPSPFVGDF